mmetsp:Transcript_3503/g.2077  ORF Transcript_3503/g.2077 Transcript_3503/m.2077 type:complete len:500 (+) Transcript_3503:1082-2581(+)
MNKSILLVDDSEGIRKVLGISLADRGYRVITAKTGEEALKLFRTHSPSIVLTDIKLPLLDGVELLKIIKNENFDTEVIMMTGHGDLDFAIKSLKYGATDFILKPINDEVLEIALNRAHERISMRGQIKDYTENLEKLVREQSALYQQLFDSVPCYITVQNRSLQFTATNRMFKEDFGDERRAFCYQIYKNRETPCPDCPVLKTFEDGESHQSEMVVTSKSGEEYNVLIRTAPIRNNTDEITQVMEMSTNITEIRKMQDQLSSLGMLLGTISHGIKGLLTGLDGGVYMLNLGFKKEDKAQIKEGWEAVKLMIERIRSMIHDILYYAKERDLKWKRVDVLSFAKDVAFTVEPKIRKHEIQFEIDFDPFLGMFEIDAGVVRSALVNILENAIDACIEDKAKLSHRIVFKSSLENDFVIFDVYDDGCGVDQEAMENIFTLFYSRKEHHGTGFGLYISKKIIRQHGGTIQVDSVLGKGSHFRIRIPKILPEEAKEAYGQKIISL